MQDCKLRIICPTIAHQGRRRNVCEIKKKSKKKKKTRRPTSTYVDLRRLASTWIDLTQDNCIEVFQCPVRLPELNKHLLFFGTLRGRFLCQNLDAIALNAVGNSRISSWYNS